MQIVATIICNSGYSTIGSWGWATWGFRVGTWRGRVDIDETQAKL